MKASFDYAALGGAVLLIGITGFVLDSAFQMASVWCYEQHGCVSLPSRAESYRQFRTGFPDAGVVVALEVTGATARRMRGDFTFMDRRGEVIALVGESGCGKSVTMLSALGIVQNLLAAEGVDTFITGEGAHHTTFDALESGINVLYAGHYATETFGVRALQALVEGWGLETTYLEAPTGL